MDKLIKLANQYVEENWMGTKRTKNEEWYICWEWEWKNISEIVLISKHYWFVARLAINNLVDRRKVKEHANTYREDESPVYNEKIRYERLLMMLSVSLRPLDLLINFLK